jgi:outer membrane protein assembly factor BamB
VAENDPVDNSANKAGNHRLNDRIDVAEGDWPWWRGPFRNGSADPNQDPPIRWSENQNILWKAPLPGRGHGSPAVVGSRVFLATADDDSGSQSILCVDRETGQQRWRKTVHPSGGMKKNAKATAASGTPACFDNQVFINFPNDGKLITTALNFDGDILWQRTISDYIVHQGYGASPTLYQDLVIVSSDNKGGGKVMALRRSSGDIVWQQSRPSLPNYSSPVIVHANGRDQLIMTGCDQVVSIDPVNGQTLWEMAGATTECVTSTVTNGELIYTSGGYPRNHMSAIVADGSKRVEWENGTRLYVPSLVIRDNHLYGVMDEGIAVCWQADTGRQLWKQRLGGTFSSSPVLVNDRIYATNESGKTFVYRADPAGYESISENELGSDVFATPAICGGRIYHRVTLANADGQLQQHLVCLSTWK